MKKLLIGLLVIAGLALLALAIYYFVTPAGSLPHVLPGYEAGSAHKHTKHGLAAVILGLGAWVLAWFMSGKKSAEASKPTSESENTD